MEIPPSSSVAQISAYFTGFSEEEKQKQFLDIHPFTAPFKPTNSLDIIPAASSSGLPTEFKTEDFKYAWQMYLGQLMYPFDNIAQVTHHQFDPLYFDGSEERAAAFNVQENLISLPLDSPQLVDPRVSYIDSLMKMREYTAGNIPLDSSYLNTLFMSTTEKGANYYLNQLKDLDEALGKKAREGYAIKNSVEIPEDVFRRHAVRGVPTHTQLESSIQTRFMENFSSTATTQSNYRRDQMKQAEFINKPNPYPNPIPDDLFQSRMENRKRKKEVIESKEQELKRQREEELKRQREEEQPFIYRVDARGQGFYGGNGVGSNDDDVGSYGGNVVTEETRNDEQVERGPELHVYKNDARDKLVNPRNTYKNERWYQDDWDLTPHNEKKGRAFMDNEYMFYGKGGKNEKFKGKKLLKETGGEVIKGVGYLAEAETHELLNNAQEVQEWIGAADKVGKEVQQAAKKSGQHLRKYGKEANTFLSIGVMGAAKYAYDNLGWSNSQGGKKIQ